MKFNFKIQDYQTQAVDSVVKVFKGQSKSAGIKYRLDLGQERPKSNSQMKVGFDDSEFHDDGFVDTAFKNKELELDASQLLTNIKSVQINNGIRTSEELVKGQGACSLDIEMETGERVIIVTGCINVLVSRVSGTLTKYNSCIA